MSEDRILALLKTVAPASFVPREPGTVALLRSRVAAAGGDPDAVARWVDEHGGYVDRTEPILHRGLGPRYGTVSEPGEEFYVVPRAVLDGE